MKKEKISLLVVVEKKEVFRIDYNGMIFVNGQAVFKDKELAHLIWDKYVSQASRGAKKQTAKRS